jgi:protein O-GlcNAc transferase
MKHNPTDGLDAAPDTLSMPVQTTTPDLQRHNQSFLRARSFEKAHAWQAADDAYRQLLAEYPGHKGGLLQRATVLQRLGRLQEGLACLDRLIALDPLQPLAHCNRGAMLEMQGQANAAGQAYQRALELNPGLVQAAINLGILLMRAGNGQQADQVIQHALAHTASHAAGNNALRYQWARLLRQWGRHQEAVDMLRATLRTEPHNVEVLLELGGLLMIQGRIEVAKSCYVRLLRQQADHRLGLFNLAQALEALGQPEAAIRAHQAALALDPGATEVLYQLEFLRLTLCDWHDYDARMAQLQERLAAHTSKPDAPVLSPLRLLSVPISMALHLRIAQQWSDSFSSEMRLLRTAPAARAMPAATHSAQGVVRIGYMGADFRDHAMGRLIHGLFRHHDRARFEVFAYSLADTADACTDSIKRGVDHFCNVAAYSAQAIADRIRGDRIDVLIDLMGHTHMSRPAVLALRPAPLQLLYLGYPGSMGADFIDGIIADDWLIPAHLEPAYRECVYRLPCAFVWSEAPADGSQEAATQPLPSRAALGLPAEGVVFACFNRAHKLDPHTFDIWLEILRQVPTSVLWLIQEAPVVQQNLRARASAAGVDAARLIFTPPVPAADFAGLCALADLFLDTAHYGAGATAVTALRAGLPVLTCPAETFASRMGASLCAATGTAEMICTSPSAYLTKAVALANHPHALAQLRRRLLEQGDQLPLFQTAHWVQELESLLDTLLNGQKP